LEVLHLTAQSRLHVVNNFLQLPEPDQICHICPFITDQYRIPKSLRKHRNSTETGKFYGLARNSTFCWKLWSLYITMFTVRQLPPSIVRLRWQ